ncbi:MAG: bacteriohopanetetrol glucosamine biosynthesis glycosyltransferase HpnI [Acidobacteria bacterium]|nr:bacteriohopanetetrol glucosamine biosynthesis glycosyltransferase HpnI [Acidobacteriota bacterium]
MHSVWRDAILLIALAPLAYYIVATIAALRFLGRNPRSSPKPDTARKDFTPPISLLKPVHGVDFASKENYESFCRQNYPDYEILFAVNDDSDPAVPLIREIAGRFPERNIRLISGAPQVGANKKVNNLIELNRAARHEIIVLTDGDVRVLPNYLREVVAPFADPKIGAVTSFYRGIAQNSLGAELEAIGAASDFFGGVLVAEWMEGMTFALGASIATTKTWVAKIGGFEAIADMHSDDYELGYRIAKAGGKVVLSRELVWTMYPAQSARGFWNHQVRWLRTVRLSRPFSFLGLIFTHGLPWAIAAALVAPTRSIATVYLVAYGVLRLLTAWFVGVKVVGDEIVRQKMWLVPFRDAIHFVVWLASFASNKISWGGEQFTMREGRMTPLQRS